MSDILNLGIKLIVDKNNNKTYLSVDGNIGEASENEKIEVRDALVEAFSKILKINDIDESNAIQENDDFEKKEEVSEIDIFESMMEDTEDEFQDEIKEEKEKKSAEKHPENTKNVNGTLESFKNIESVTMGIGDYAEYTAYEILALYGKAGIEELYKIKPDFVTNKYINKEESQKRRIAIDKAIELYRELEIA